MNIKTTTNRERKADCQIIDQVIKEVIEEEEEGEVVDTKTIEMKPNLTMMHLANIQTTNLIIHKKMSSNIIIIRRSLNINSRAITITRLVNTKNKSLIHISMVRRVDMDQRGRKRNQSIKRVEIRIRGSNSSSRHMVKVKKHPKIGLAFLKRIMIE
jgi:hypothetical protein